MSTTSRRRPGWYDDEADTAMLRYWNGDAWTPHTTSRPVDAPESTMTLTLVHEHTTMPLPPAPGTPAAFRLGFQQVAWIVIGALFAGSFAVWAVSSVIAVIVR